jgi:hypothetical protein
MIAGEVLLSKYPQAIAEFNKASREIQVVAGVDPDACLKLTGVVSAERTKLPIFFDYLQRGLWVTPAADGRENGNWALHDENLHWPGVRKLHPGLATLVMQSATIGTELLANDRLKEAWAVGDRIDYLVDRDSTQFRYDNVVVLCAEFGFDTSSVPSYEMQVAHEAQINRAMLNLH